MVERWTDTALVSSLIFSQGKQHYVLCKGIFYQATRCLIKTIEKQKIKRRTNATYMLSQIIVIELLETRKFNLTHKKNCYNSYVDNIR